MESHFQSPILSPTFGTVTSCRMQLKSVTKVYLSVCIVGPLWWQNAVVLQISDSDGFSCLSEREGK